MNKYQCWDKLASSNDWREGAELPYSLTYNQIKKIFETSWKYGQLSGIEESLNKAKREKELMDKLGQSLGQNKPNPFGNGGSSSIFDEMFGGGISNKKNK